MWNKIKSKPLLKNFILAGITAILIVVIILLWMRFYTNHGEKIETPNFVGLSLEEAKKLAEENNLRLAIDSVFADKPRNSIILQNPVSFSDSTESWIKSNRIIYLTVVRKDKQLISFPDIKDKHKTDAHIKLTVKGFVPNWDYQPGPYKDVVLSTSFNGKKVKEGDKIPKGSSIKVVLAKGEEQGVRIQVPNFIGKTINEANLELIDKQLVLTARCPTCETEQDSLNAKIIKQTPDFVTGYTLMEGSEVFLILEK